MNFLKQSYLTGRNVFRRFACTEVSTLEQFQEQVQKPKGLKVVKFHASWCKPCQIMAPIIDKMSNDYPSVGFYSIDVDANESVAAEYQVDTLPTVHVFIDGHSMKSFIGTEQAESIESFIVKNLPK